MDILKKYKHSTKFICQKCGYPVTAKDGTESAISGRCSPCIEGIRHNKMNWPAWKKGMELAQKKRAS